MGKPLNINVVTELVRIVKGGSGSGNWGHAGIPGKRGGSGPGGGLLSLGLGKTSTTSERKEHSDQTREVRKMGVSSMRELKNRPLKVTPKSVEQQLDEARKISQILAQGRFSTKVLKVGGDGPFVAVSFPPEAYYSLTGEVKNELVTQLSADSNVPYEDVNGFIRQWAMSSNDADKRSLSVQESGAKAFNTELSDWQKDWIAVVDLRREVGVDLEKQSRAFESSSGNLRQGLRDRGFSDSQQVEELLLKTMYSNTQKKFKDEGITSVTLYRGTGQDVGKVGEAVGIKTNALESWTLDYDTASSFADGFTVLKAEVPVERIVGTAGTGFGALHEWEIVVIGGIKGDRAQIVEPSV